MKKYEVEIKVIDVYLFPEIIAENEKEAEEKAGELYYKNKEDYYYDSDSEVEIIEIEGK